MKSPIPIFIIVCDRLKVLKESIRSYYDNINTPFEIIIHDNNTTFEPTIEYLNKLEASGVNVHRHHLPNTQSDYAITTLVNLTVERWYEKYDSEYYIVTDPDIALDNTAKDILEFYKFLLEKFPNADAVGPMLRIDDIPSYYPLKEKAIQRHTKQFWYKEPASITYENKQYYYQESLIDQSFAMYRKNFMHNYKKIKPAIRTYSPYSARHLDWYINPTKMSEDQKYYVKHAGKNAHWGGSWLDDMLRNYDK
jgi:hypothetical protein